MNMINQARVAGVVNELTKGGTEFKPGVRMEAAKMLKRPYTKRFHKDFNEGLRYVRAASGVILWSKSNGEPYSE